MGRQRCTFQLKEQEKKSLEKRELKRKKKQTKTDKEFNLLLIKMLNELGIELTTLRILIRN